MGTDTILRTGNNDPFTIGILERAKRYLADVHGCWPIREIEDACEFLTNFMCVLRGLRFHLIENGRDLWRLPKFNGASAKKRARLFAQKSSSRFM